MRTVYKFNIPRTGKEPVMMPVGAGILKVGIQNGSVYCWADVGTDLELEPRLFRIYGTGFEIPKNARHIGTLFEELFVWHVYEEFYVDKT